MKHIPPTLVQIPRYLPYQRILKEHFHINESEIGLITIHPEKTSLGIQDIQSLRKSLQWSGAQDSIIVFPVFEKTTHEAQNALLKLLEDSSSRFTFILMTPAVEAVLPTIQSRCRIVRLKGDQADFPDDSLRELFEAAREGNRTIYFQHKRTTIQSAEEAHAFLLEILSTLHGEIQQGSTWASKSSKIALEIVSLLKNNNMNAQLAVDLWFLRSFS